jgi:GT2 family glycosyltransferase
MGIAQLAVGIVLYRNTPEQIAKITGSARAALDRCGLPGPHAILLYDNGGEAPVPTPPGVKVLASATNRGFGAGHNALMAAAFADGADAYIGANPDGAFHPDAIAHLVAQHRACGGRALIEAHEFPDEHLKVYDPETLATSWISGACFFVPKSLFVETGGFDEHIFLYCEDVDFSWTALRQGYRLMHCPTAYFYHETSERNADDASEAWRLDFMLRSGRYLGHKWSCDSFRDWCESELRSRGSTDALPDLAALPRLTDADHSAEFAHRFAFSDTR